MLSDFDGTVNDEARWRKRNGITAETPVFIMSGWYPDIKAALIERGWRQNPNRDSPFFELMWVLKGKSINHNALKPHQVVNHFSKATSVTTKSGLMKSLRSLRWFEPVDIDTFFPRCYDLSEPGDYADFVDDYKACVAERNLKRIIARVVEAAGTGAGAGIGCAGGNAQSISGIACSGHPAAVGWQPGAGGLAF